MSCGQPHDTDCAEVLSRVYDFLDGEIDDERREEIRVHLDECGPCLAQFGLERAVKELVHRSCACTHAPESLRVRIVTRIEQIRVEYRRRG
jgi:mycothiol system anti-sigma-R factor